MTDHLAWFKSSYSDAGGGDCIEVAYDWHKSSYSDNTGGDCVEVATTPATVHIRDSKNPDAPHLRIPATAWADFLTFATA
ncbi:DUF397 domain-containing protein [Streptomyces sp. DASNCL29]|uniref:DUF397 domain-containing protein n=1 Tax=Streptomyces sp. DASNCL29 TaxID=2583819 RepID=UPI00110FB649|nr:DUF397 domain-containing protein [Streptomyces sp. DASNCL29]TMU90269.1 DUF397 domain-containing protein [Streptomyces sp. DASNCL29]